MNILFVVPYVPNLIRVRPYNLIRYLTERGHRVTVMTMWTSDAEKASLDPLREVCHRVEAVKLPKLRSYINCLAALPSATPLQAVYCWQPEFAAIVAEAASRRLDDGRPAYDVVHIEHLRGARFGLHLRKQLGKSDVPLIWDSVDCISHLFRQSSASSKKRLSRWTTRFELGRTEKYEGWLVSQFDRVLVTSRLDREALLKLTARPEAAAPVHVLPNGVDLDYFSPGAVEKREPATLVISGKMSYHANVSMVLYFANRILPLIRAQRPDVRLVVVGKDPPAEILALGSQPNITVTGFVSDIRPYLQTATAAVAPLTYGAGIQNKVLEAMACGTPVVTTQKAVAALEITHGCELLVGENEERFAGEVLRLLNNPDLCRQIGMEGRRYVENRHRWTDIAGQLENIYQEAVAAAIAV